MPTTFALFGLAMVALSVAQSPSSNETLLPGNATVQNATVQNATVPPVQNATVPNVPPVGNATGPTVPPVQNVTVPNVPPVGNATGPTVPPVQKVTVPNVPPVGNATVPPVQNVTVPNVPPVTNTTVQPVKNATVPTSPPVQNATVPNVQPVDNETDSDSDMTSQGLNVNEVIAITGWNGAVTDLGETLLLKLPRSQQLNLRIKGIFVPGAGCESVLRPQSDGSVNMMAELLLLEDEIDPVLRYALSEPGLHVTALHKHFLFDAPPAYFMHLHGNDNSQAAAFNLRNITETIGSVRARPPPATAPSIETRLSTLALAPIQSAVTPHGLNATQNAADGSVTLTASPHKCTVMGSNASHTLGCQSSAKLAGSDADAVAFGYIATDVRNLQSVLVDALLDHNLTITAIVNHFVQDDPQTMFVYLWGRGPAPDLGRALAEVIAATF